MSEEFYCAAHVALYTGVTPSTVKKWLEDETFPQPESVHYGPTGKVASRGWSPHQIAEIRAWREAKMGLEGENATAHWLLVDNHAVNTQRTLRDHVSEGQLTFEVPVQAAAA